MGPKKRILLWNGVFAAGDRDETAHELLFYEDLYEQMGGMLHTIVSSKSEHNVCCDKFIGIAVFTSKWYS